MKVVQLHEYKPEHFSKPSTTPQKSLLGPKKFKIDHKIKSNSNVRIERNIENETCLTTLVDPKTVVEPHSNPKSSPLGPQKFKNAVLGQIYPYLELKVSFS